jgi:hypothetical protein
MEKIFVTPANHRVHHAQNQLYIDKNYAGIFILWDRMFGSYQDELDEEKVVFGVRKPLQSWNPFWANLQVYDYLLFDAIRTKRWRDKIGIWFRRTGWRPADVAAKYPKRSSDLATFRKFEIQLAPGVKRYTVIQFIFAILMIIWIGFVYATQGLEAAVLPCILFWTLLYSIGMLNDGKRFSAEFEMFRLFIVMPAGMYGLLHSSGSDWAPTNAWTALVIYAVVSAALLRPALKREVTT